MFHRSSGDVPKFYLRNTPVCFAPVAESNNVFKQLLGTALTSSRTKDAKRNDAFLAPVALLLVFLNDAFSRTKTSIARVLQGVKKSV